MPGGPRNGNTLRLWHVCGGPVCKLHARGAWFLLERPDKAEGVPQGSVQRQCGSCGVPPVLQGDICGDRGDVGL